MCVKLELLVCLLAFGHISKAGPASFITKCKQDDTKCQKESTQAAFSTFSAGIPEIGVESLDPLHYDRMDASSNNLKFFLNDINITGVKNCHVKKMTKIGSKLIAKALCNVRLDGQYEMSGHILVIPIEGKGKAKVIINQVLLTVEADITDKVGSDGKNHWHVASWKHSYELKDKAEIDLENLFPGNQVLGRAASELLNTSANEVIAEVGPPIIKALLSKVVKTVDKFFKEVPVEDLVDLN